MRRIPVDNRRTDWPRLVSDAMFTLDQRVSAMAPVSGGSFVLDDGTATAGGSFALDDGAA